jgi:hypothetical protein
MSYRKNGLKALGLMVVAALGLMAFMATGAQANWLVNGVELKANEAVAATAHTNGILTVPAKKLEIECTTLASKNLKLLASSATAEGEVEFSNCTTFSPPGAERKEQKNCKPGEPIKAGGKAKLILHNAQNYVLFEPTTAGGKFATITFGELCSLTETSDVKGTLVAECLTSALAHADCNTSEASHLIQPAPAALFTGDKLTYGAGLEATLKGVAKVELSGESKGKPWAGHV